MPDVEVRTSPSGHLGLFATRDFAEGDVILEEAPLVVLAPSSEQESREILLDWMGGGKDTACEGSKGKKSSMAGHPSGGGAPLWHAIDPPDAFSVPENMRGTFKGMAQAGIVWMEKYHNSMDGSQDALQKLYRPPDGESATDVEKTVVALADDVIKFLQDSISRCTSSKLTNFEGWEKMKDVLLVWACNSFQGGRVYEMLSRVNHDCNPNAVIQTTPARPTNDDEPNGTNDEGQRLVAAAKIAKGDEVSISYLGLLLYADKNARRTKLRATKYFDCRCQRCSAPSTDRAAQIPCPVCHPRRSSQLMLEEDVQYDDDQTVRYATMDTKCSTCHEQPERGSKLEKVIQSVESKIQSYLDTHEGLNKAKETSGNAVHDDDDNEEENNAVLEEHVGLASTMMGDKHWTTNLMLLLHLDSRLAGMSTNMLTSQEPPEMEDIAEAIDSLERISRFVDSLSLKIDPGHLLGDVTIGIARTLVSLGDEKSQKYGAEWLDKIDDYTTLFGSDGLQKVVAALRVAWKKHGRTNDGENTPSGSKQKQARTNI